jgi:hypothetical protein
VEEKQSTEQAVQIRCEQRQIDRGGTGFLYDNWHKAIETKHAGTKANIEQSWGGKRRRVQSFLQGIVSIHCESTIYDSPCHIYQCLLLANPQLKQNEKSKYICGK